MCGRSCPRGATVNGFPSEFSPHLTQAVKKYQTVMQLNGAAKSVLGASSFNLAKYLMIWINCKRTSCHPCIRQAKHPKREALGSRAACGSIWSYRSRGFLGKRKVTRRPSGYLAATVKHANVRHQGQSYGCMCQTSSATDCSTCFGRHASPNGPCWLHSLYRIHLVTARGQNASVPCRVFPSLPGRRCHTNLLVQRSGSRESGAGIVDHIRPISGIFFEGKAHVAGGVWSTWGVELEIIVYR